MIEKGEDGMIGNLMKNIGHPDQQYAKKVFHHIAGGLNYMPRIVIVHSDIKPDNIPNRTSLPA